MKAGSYMSISKLYYRNLRIKKSKELIAKFLKFIYLINLLNAINVVWFLIIILKNMVLLLLILKSLMSLVIKPFFAYTNNVIFANSAINAFTLKSSIVDNGCFISNNTKYHIANDLRKNALKKILLLIIMFLPIL